MCDVPAFRPRPGVTRPRLLLIGLLLLAAPPAEAQRVAKYGADFLAGGVGARALGMGGAHVALAEDVTAGYWNPAGLHGLRFPEAAYMHAERFAGTVQFDYGAVGLPLDARTTLALSFVRSAVDDIPNTLDAWEGGQPRPERVTFFSAADYAFFVSVARALRTDLQVGASVKVVRRRIGSFAGAWGYGLDVGVRHQRGAFVLGAALRDATGLVQTWRVDAEALAGLEAFDVGVPEGGAEIALPVLRLAAGTVDLPLGRGLALAAGLDVDVAFDGQRAYVLHAGDASFHPRLGAELAYRDVVALRAGLSDLTTSERFGTSVTPSLGAGLVLGPLAVDYGFGDVAGVQRELGPAHRVSLRYTLRLERLARPEP